MLGLGNGSDMEGLGEKLEQTQVLVQEIIRQFKDPVILNYRNLFILAESHSIYSGDDS